MPYLARKLRVKVIVAALTAFFDRIGDDLVHGNGPYHTKFINGCYSLCRRVTGWQQATIVSFVSFTII